MSLIQKVVKKLEVGDIFVTNQGCECEVIEYNGAFNVIVKFKDKYGHTKRVSTGDLRKGEVSNPFHPSVFGVGYLGVDKNSVFGFKSDTREYMFWKGMLERCYSERSWNVNPTYIGCTVHEDWHNFQNFAKWCNMQIGFSEAKWQLDKDLLGGDVKMYAPDHCVFVPLELNTLFNVPTTKTDELPTGVSFSKQRNKYVASIGNGGYTKALGRYETVEDAKLAYLTAKTTRIKELIDKYSDRVDSRVLKYLSNLAGEQF